MGIDEAAKKVKSLPATVTAAMQIKTLHHHKKHRHGDLKTRKISKVSGKSGSV